LNSSLANLLQDGLFYIYGNSSGVITFKKGGESEGGAGTSAGGATGGATNATGTGAGGATGVRKLLQAIQGATGGHTGEATGAATGAATGGVTATKVNNTQWTLSGTFKNWKVDGVSILVHDVITKNGVIHVGVDSRRYTHAYIVALMAYH
jgi:hypothetical protein